MSPDKPSSPPTAEPKINDLSVSQPPPSPTPTQSKSKKNLMVAAIIAAILLLGGSAAAYLGIVVPNSPDRIWSSSLNNTAKGYDKLVTYADSQKGVKGGTLSGTFKLESSGIVADGKIDSKYYDQDSQTKLDIGAAGARFNLDLHTKVTAASKNPDIYVKASGLKGLDQLLGPGAGGAGQQLSSLDNQWLAIDHTLLDQLEKSEGGEQSPAISAINNDDAITLAKDMGEVSKQYLLTDDPTKAVMVVKQNVGKKNMDGRSVYHFKVGVDKENLKDFNKAACEKFADSKLVKAVSGASKTPFTKKECNDDANSFDSIKNTDTFDVYVDMKTKLIRTVRFTDEKNKEDYVDIGLHYNGGDVYPFVIKFVSKPGGAQPSGKGDIKITLNTKTDKINIDVNASAEGVEPVKINLKATLQPSNDKVQVTKPADAKPLQEFLGPLLGGLEAGMPAGSSSQPEPSLFN